MPELPEVQALVDFLAERTDGLAVTGVELGSISVLKTFNPPPQALAGLVDGSRDTGSSSTSTATAPTWSSTWPAPAGCAGATRSRRRCSGRGSRRSPCGSASPTAPASTSPRRGRRSGWPPTSSATRRRCPASRRWAPTRWPRTSRGGLRRAARTTAGRRSRGCCATSRSSPASATPTPTRSCTWRRCRRSRWPARSTTAPWTGCMPRCGRRFAAVVAASGKPAAELKDAKRAGMRVHGRTGETCPVCGDTVREVSFADSSLQYCATCQTGGKPLADRRMSRLLSSRGPSRRLVPGGHGPARGSGYCRAQ